MLCTNIVLSNSTLYIKLTNSVIRRNLKLDFILHICNSVFKARNTNHTIKAAAHHIAFYIIAFSFISRHQSFHKLIHISFLNYKVTSTLVVIDIINGNLRNGSIGIISWYHTGLHYVLIINSISRNTIVSAIFSNNKISVNRGFTIHCKQMDHITIYSNLCFAKVSHISKKVAVGNDVAQCNSHLIIFRNSYINIARHKLIKKLYSIGNVCDYVNSRLIRTRLYNFNGLSTVITLAVSVNVYVNCALGGTITGLFGLITITCNERNTHASNEQQTHCRHKTLFHFFNLLICIKLKFLGHPR